MRLRSHQAQSGISVRTVQINKSGLNSRADSGCLTISAIEPSKKTQPYHILVQDDTSKRLIAMNCTSKQSVKILFSPLVGASIRHHHH